MRVHTGRLSVGDSGRKVVTPDPGGDVLCIPYFRNDVVVNCKYTKGKGDERQRWQIAGAPLIFYNLDEAMRRHVAEPNKPLVITEGEIDCMTAHEVGEVAISVPNGAPPGTGPVAYEPPGEGESEQFAYLDDEAQSFITSFNRVIIATDGDAPGIRLRDELVRRIGRARSAYVDYPEGAKDLNDLMMADGADSVRYTLAKATPFPLRGLYRFSDYADELPIEGYDTGITRLNPFYRPHLGSLTVITGIPSHGKSTFAIDVAASMARQYNWRLAIWSSEMRAKRVHYCLVSAYANTPFERATGADWALGEQWAEQNVFLIDGGQHDDKVTVNWICDRVVEAVRRDGIRIAVLDVWGDMDHPLGRDGITTDYVSDALKRLRRVALDLGILMLLVAHPRKITRREDGSYEKPGAYHISGSAHFYNKVDFSLTVHRRPDLYEAALIDVEKVRYQPETGEPGEVVLNFNRATGKYR